MRARPYAVIALLASIMGFAFSAVSTYDSTAHLDRQVHGIHCSYFLGMGEKDAAGSSGCYATLMSPYSSVLRESIWGGVPVALPGMSVFGFLVYWIVFMIVGGRFSVRPSGFLLAATSLWGHRPLQERVTLERRVKLVAVALRDPLVWVGSSVTT